MSLTPEEEKKSMWKWVPKSKLGKVVLVLVVLWIVGSIGNLMSEHTSTTQTVKVTTEHTNSGDYPSQADLDRWHTTRAEFDATEKAYSQAMGR